MDAFQPGAFDHAFQLDVRSATITQTLGGLDQSASVMVEIEGVGGPNVQSLGGFTQAAVGTSGVVSAPGHGGGQFLPPGFFKERVPLFIRQEMPAFTQSLSGEVNDDELVLLLVL